MKNLLLGLFVACIPLVSIADPNNNLASLEFYGQTSREAFDENIRLPLDKALRELDAGITFSTGWGSSAPDADGNRRITRMSTYVRMDKPDLALPLIKQMLLDIGVRDGAEIRFIPTSPWQSLTLLDGQWTPTDEVGFDFVAEAMVPDALVDKAIVALIDKHPRKPPVNGLLARVASLEPNAAMFIQSQLKANGVSNPVRIAFQRTDHDTMMISVLCRGRIVSDEAQAVLDAQLL